ncbi:diaminopimelate epimerase [Streptomyces sp. RB6PN25]|uniref:Diaminopimelate epimerase n=1 Tax=Streptomyces humicola TaxID=2953240 RepID=A0ABT1PTX0_9ACTN|nr:diaminopimelate epimerase [Streptomyces humicola]MCQ4081116.1 diaminopimelate epimerase [Streptomyces humicola]
MRQDTWHPADFVKYEALGNNYVVVDPRYAAFAPLPENVRRVCDRNRGLGADGLLYGPLPAADGFRLLTFNADGSECGGSGNGLRIFAWYLRESGHTEADVMTLRTPSGTSTATIVDADSGVVRVGLGTARPDSGAVGARGPARTMLREPLDAAGRRWEAGCVRLGSPHCVLPLADAPADAGLARRVGAAVSSHDLFPDRINVELLHVTDRENLSIEVFERVAGHVPASGSGAAAAAYVAHARGLSGPRVTVHMPGGRVTVDIGEDGAVSLTGEVGPVLRGHWAPRLARSLSG